MHPCVQAKLDKKNAKRNRTAAANQANAARGARAGNVDVSGYFIIIDCSLRCLAAAHPARAHAHVSCTHNRRDERRWPAKIVARARRRSRSVA